MITVWASVVLNRTVARGGVLPYMGYIGMCRCEGYGFQAVFSGIGHKLGRFPGL